MADGDALYAKDGASTFVPTDLAVGPWDRDIVHGAAVAALFAGQLASPEHTLARLTLEFLRPVPLGPLDLQITTGGGRRVQRQDAVLTSDGREVATARAVLVVRNELDLPEKTAPQASPFDPDDAPPLDELNAAAAEMVGWESFDSRCVVWQWMKVPDDRRTHGWIRLAVPVVEGTEVQGVELAAVAADYAQAAANRQLSMLEWSFRNAEQTVHLTREPTGPWMGMRCEALIQPVGAGFNAADLFDADGHVGRSAAVLVVEPR